jgi:threonine dehydrogenase-like Zn-dependent dehydrogenase
MAPALPQPRTLVPPTLAQMKAAVLTGGVIELREWPDYHRELTITATYSSSPAELAEAFELLSGGRVRVDGLISHRLPLERLGEGVELMRRHEAVKVYVIP